jgi:hypothetical protein
MEEKRESRTCEEDGPGLHWHTTLFSTGGCSWPSYPGSPREGGGPCRVWGAHGFGTTGLTYLFDLRVPGPHPEEGVGVLLRDDPHKILFWTRDIPC